METEPFAGHASPSEKKPKIRKCPYCKQDYSIENPWRELWRMPTLNEWITLAIIVLMLLTAYAYKRDMAVCREYAKNVAGNYTPPTFITESKGINISSQIATLNNTEKNET